MTEQKGHSVGARVRLNQKAISDYVQPGAVGRVGIVVGTSSRRYPESVSVLWVGYKAATRLHRTFLEAVTDPNADSVMPDDRGTR